VRKEGNEEVWQEDFWGFHSGTVMERSRRGGGRARGMLFSLAASFLLCGVLSLSGSATEHMKLYKNK